MKVVWVRVGMKDDQLVYEVILRAAEQRIHAAAVVAAANVYQLFSVALLSDHDSGLVRIGPY